MSYQSGHSLLAPTVGQQVPQMLPPAPMAQPQMGAYSGGGLCDTPPIPMYSAPPCNGPGAVNITRRVFTVINGGFTITVGDTANPVITAVLGAPNGLFVTTDSTTTGVIRDITVSFDPFAGGAGGADATPATPDDLTAYAWAVSSLLAGTITVNNTPFPTVIPIGSAIKTLGGIRARWTLAQSADLWYMSPTFETTHDSAPAPIEIALPQASNFQVVMVVPSRAAPFGGASGDRLYTGIVSVLLEEQTQLGSVPGSY